MKERIWKRMKESNKYIRIFWLCIALCISLCGCEPENLLTKISQQTTTEQVASVELDSIPEFSDQPYVIVNDNQPEFTESDYTTESFEEYSELDSLGRCGTAMANIGQDLMPTEKRGEIGPVKPSGWHTVKYDCVDGKYLYNRCHLIGYQLSGENANEKNLVTGTRYLNVEGMLPFENEVADYVKETNYHVLYRVTPVYDGDDLVASGIQMEAWSVEDNGEGICFNIYAYNNQPGVEIDYATGDSELETDTAKATDDATKADTAEATDNAMKADTAEAADNATKTDDTQNVTDAKEESAGEYVVNTNTRKFHKTTCSSVSDILSSNRETIQGSRSELIEKGYEPCQRCQP